MRSRNVAPVKQFRDDVGKAPLAADVVERDDIRMIERGGGAGFLLEARDAVAVSRHDLPAGP